MVDSSFFKHQSRFQVFNSEKLLDKVFDLINDAYFSILESEKYFKSEMGFFRENQYRDDLVNYMRKLQTKHGLSCIHIESEVQEISEGNVGRLDIKIIYTYFDDAKLRYENYHAIECKRFSKSLNLNDYYEKGVVDFLSGNYSCNNDFAGMVCFIEEFWECNALVSRINNYLESKGVSTLEKVGDGDVFYLRNPRFSNNEIICIKHLFLDYKNIVT